MMQKFIAGIALVAFTTICGYFLARKFRQRKLFFEQLQEFNERFLSEISYYRRPIRDFVAKYAYKGAFDELLRDYFARLKRSENLTLELLNEPKYAFLNVEEKRVLEDYFLMLGRGDSASQKGYFSSVKPQLTALRSDEQTACKRYGDLYIKIGFLCGLFLLILML